MHPLILITIIASGFFLVYHLLLYIVARVPIVDTPKKYYKELFANIEINSNSTIYELGCSYANFLFEAEKLNPKKLKGFELSPFHVIFARLKAKIKNSKTDIEFADFFKADLSDANIIYLFLVKDVVNKAWKKIRKECKQGTVVIVLSDQIADVDCYKKIPTMPNEKKSTFYRLYKV